MEAPASKKTERRNVCVLQVITAKYANRTCAPNTAKTAVLAIKAASSQAVCALPSSWAGDAKLTCVPVHHAQKAAMVGASAKTAEFVKFSIDWSFADVEKFGAAPNAR